jgi:hypothetical protein
MLQDIQRMGRWNQDIMANNYLNSYGPAGLMALMNWTICQQEWPTAYFHPRFCAIVPQELKDAFFPWAPMR